MRVPLFLTCLPCFAQNLLANVHNTLTLVWLWLLESADLGGDLADLLLVDTRHDDHHSLVRYINPLWGFVVDFVAKAQAHRQLVIARRNPKAHTFDLKALLVPLGHANHHVVDEGAHQPMLGPSQP